MILKKILWMPILISGLAISAAGCSNISTNTPTPAAAVETLSPTPTPTAAAVSGILGQQLDDYFTGSRPLFSGSVLAARHGEVLLDKGYNYADWELRVPNEPQTKFRITSLTKQFTATLIMMMHERGLIDLDDSICSYLEDCLESWKEITVHQLLTHTSGIPEYTILPDALEESRQPHNVQGLLNLFNGEQLDFTPGEEFKYSNSNYVVLGAILEQISGSTYEQYLNEHVLRPLEMEDSGLDRQDVILQGRASGYLIVESFLLNAPYLDMSNAYSTAGMYSTVEDLYKWDQALYTDQLLNEESREMMFSTEVGEGINSNYGYGWQIGDAHGQRKIWHAGRINGFHSYLSRYPDDQTTIIILSNIETEDLDEIVFNLENILFPPE